MLPLQPRWKGRRQWGGDKDADKFFNGRQVQNLRGVIHDCFISELGARPSAESGKKVCRKLEGTSRDEIVKVEEYQEMPRAQLSLQP